MLSKRKKKIDRTVPERMRRYRARKLNKKRAEQETLIRNLLQAFFEANEVPEGNWVTINEFYRDSLSPIIDRESFVGGLRHMDGMIETSTAYFLGGEIVEILRPRYFLAKEDQK